MSDVIIETDAPAPETVAETVPETQDYEIDYSQQLDDIAVRLDNLYNLVNEMNYVNHAQRIIELLESIDSKLIVPVIYEDQAVYPFMQANLPEPETKEEVDYSSIIVDYTDQLNDLKVCIDDFKSEVSRDMSTVHKYQYNQQNISIPILSGVGLIVGVLIILIAANYFRH